MSLGNHKCIVVFFLSSLYDLWTSLKFHIVYFPHIFHYWHFCFPSSGLQFCMYKHVSLCNLPPLSNTQFLNPDITDVGGGANSLLPCGGLSYTLGVLSLAAFLDSHLDASSSSPYSPSWKTKKCFQTLQKVPWAGQGDKLLPVENKGSSTRQLIMQSTPALCQEAPFGCPAKKLLLDVLT